MIICDRCGDDYHRRERMVVRVDVDLFVFDQVEADHINLRGATICGCCVRALAITGCRFNGFDYAPDPLGTDATPVGWTYRPDWREVLEALGGVPGGGLTIKSGVPEMPDILRSID
jgi:hypothetical protein